NPRTCFGCCDASGVCQAGTSDSLCGRSGNLCDTCVAPAQSCVYSRCETQPMHNTSCTPTGCIGAACGVVSDSCGGMVNCTCASGLVCGTASNAHACCMPVTCASASATCGEIS